VSPSLLILLLRLHFVEKEAKIKSTGGITSPRMSRYMASPTSERSPIGTSYSSGPGYGSTGLAQAPLAATGGAAAGGAESWKRAAEVTQNLKARIEMMKASFLMG
jgi:protein STU2